MASQVPSTRSVQEGGFAPKPWTRLGLGPEIKVGRLVGWCPGMVRIEDLEALVVVEPGRVRAHE